MLVDSNILVYAINLSSPKHKKAQEFLQQNIGKLFIAHQNILETLRVLTHPKFANPMKPNDAWKALETIIKTCQIIHPNYQTYSIFEELVKKYHLSGDQIFDSYLIATALGNEITYIATDNIKDFKKFEEIKMFNPFFEEIF